MGERAGQTMDWHEGLPGNEWLRIMGEAGGIRAWDQPQCCSRDRRPGVVHTRSEFVLMFSLYIKVHVNYVLPFSVDNAIKFIFIMHLIHS